MPIIVLLRLAMVNMVTVMRVAYYLIRERDQMFESDNHNIPPARAKAGIERLQFYLLGKDALEMRENLKPCLKSQVGSPARQWDYADRRGSISSP